MSPSAPESAPPRAARVVIVGGGVAGTSVAHHLAARGWSDIVLVDQGPLWETGGSTSHAPGLVFQNNPSPTMTRFGRDTVALFSRLQHPDGPCFHPVGGLEAATTEGRWAELHRRVGRARAFGLEAELVDAARAAELVPLLDPDTVIGALHTPQDGIAKALRAVEAMVAEAGGALTAVPHCAVTGLHRASGRVRGVETTLGPIATDAVVLCGGVWSAVLSRLAGLRIPILPFEHGYAVSKAVPELAGESTEVRHPMLRHQDFSLYFRQVGDRYGIGNYRHEPRLVEPEGIREPGGPVQPALVPFRPDDFAGALAETARMLPSVGAAGIEHGINGLMAFTPDGAPLLGAVAETRGLWLAQALWVTHAGGAGRAVADLMTDGAIALDLHECDPNRFQAHGTSRAWARARNAQSYREVYDVVHPRQQSEQVRGLRRTPFHFHERELGAHFVESAGWERPLYYAANAELPVGDLPPRGDWAARDWSPIVAAEHLACRATAGLFDLTPFTKLEVSGPGALDFLELLAAGDVDKPVGRVVYTAMLSPGAGIMCDLTITRLAADRFLVVTGGAVGTHDVAWLRAHLPADGSVRLDDRTSALCCLGLWGPRARDILAPLAEGDLSFGYFGAGELHVGPVPVRALRVSYVGELGWEIYAPTEFGGALWELLSAAGAEHGLVPCGVGCYDSLRLEKGYRLWGADIDEAHDPYEAGLGWAVKLDKGDFIGRPAAAERKER
ncbi:MAG TPA: FAD-dependent oxidoreductase, partial [Solirubrobacteraceae bacterium]